jgi:hypothetical protein
MSKQKLIFVIVTAIILLGSLDVTSSFALKLTITTNKQTYNVGETVSVVGNLTKDDSTISDALLAIEIDNPKGDLFVIKTLKPETITSTSLPLQILELVPCDSNGNPQYSFPLGGNAGFKITAKNNAANSYNVVITLNIFYSNFAPFTAFVVFSGSMDPGQTITVLTWPVPIPDNAVAGNATAYANIFNDLPKNNGFPYSQEKSASFIIGKASSQATSSQSSLSGYNLTVALASTKVWLGNYTIYACTYYSLSFTSCKTAFEVILIGDIYHDGKIDMKDIIIVARAFGSMPGSQNWNSTADLNSDGVIDMRDIITVARAFGTVAILDP